MPKTHFVPLQLSIVIPIYNEADNLKPLVNKIKDSLDPKELKYEVLFIDDGSRDNTLEIFNDIHEQDVRFKLVSLKRNFGKAEAYMAGFNMASGDLIATMDGDLQDDPADLLLLMDEIQKGQDMVIGWKNTGKSSKGTFILSKLFNKGIQFFVKSTLHDLNCPIRVMTKNVAKDLYIYSSLHRYIPILVASEGYKVSEVIVSNHDRLHGKSSYSYSKYFESFFDLMTVLFVTIYRKRPLQFLGPIGTFSFTIGFSIDAYYFLLGIIGIEKMRNNIPSLMLGLTLIMIGIQIVLTGLIGEMLSREIGVSSYKSYSSIKSTIGLEQ